MIDNCALSSIRIGSDLKQALTFLTEFWSPTPFAPELSEVMGNGVNVCNLWVKNTGSSSYGVSVIATSVCGPLA